LLDPHFYVRVQGALDCHQDFHGNSRLLCEKDRPKFFAPETGQL
jgi:hypothetical protein